MRYPVSRNKSFAERLIYEITSRHSAGLYASLALDVDGQRDSYQICHSVYEVSELLLESRE